MAGGEPEPGKSQSETKRERNCVLLSERFPGAGAGQRWAQA